jgi:2-amino-4-hydroxy-6-hydroxymethyldihydropteridine diphosphokinase
VPTGESTDVAYLGLGSNVGNRGQALARLRDALTRRGVVIDGASSEILTRPVGPVSQGDFHNQVVRVRSPSPWTPDQWLALCKEAEHEAGRRPTYRWGPRVADADILLLGRDGEIAVHLPELTVPHTELRNRPFFIRLLAEVGLQSI